MDSHQAHVEKLYTQLNIFEKLFAILCHRNGGQKLNDHVYHLGSPSANGAYDLTFSCLIHGNELGGLFAINHFLTNLIASGDTFNKSLCIIIGNIKAAEMNKRFYQRDLNRCFGAEKTELYEEVLAELISPHLRASRYLVDLHQTNSPTESDFFIFPFTNSNIEFASSLGPGIPIVVHGIEFSKDGMCADSFVVENGGVAITYEMGVVGQEHLQIEKAANILVRAYLSKIQESRMEFIVPQTVFTSAEVVIAKHRRQLVPGLVNFSPVVRGLQLGYDEAGTVLAQTDGYVLFPKYGELAIYSTELCQIISAVELFGFAQPKELKYPSKIFGIL